MSRDSGIRLVGVYNSIAILHLVEGDRIGAKEYFQKAVQTGRYGNISYQIARNLLARLAG